MIDVTKILKRAWNILWSYRALWFIGLILALTTAAAMPRNNNSGWRENAPQQRPGEVIPWPTREELRDAWEQMRLEINHDIAWEDISAHEWDTVLWIIGGVFVLLLLLGVAMTIARFVAETATIRMVDEYERSGQKASLRQGLRYGWSRTAWRLFLLNLIASLPVVLLVLTGVGLGVGLFFLILADHGFSSVAGTMVAIGVAFLLIFLGVILGVGMLLLRDFFWRACVLEGAGVGEAIRLGWSMVRNNWKSVGLMWLVMIAVRIAWSIGVVIGMFLSLPVLLLTILAGALVGGLPALLVGGLSSIILNGPLPWIIGGVIGLPLFLVVALSPILFLRGLALVYDSTVWTLTYRELKALQSLASEPLPPVDIPQASTDLDTAAEAE